MGVFQASEWDGFLLFIISAKHLSLPGYMPAVLCEHHIFILCFILQWLNTSGNFCFPLQNNNYVDTCQGKHFQRLKAPCPIRRDRLKIDMIVKLHVEMIEFQWIYIWHIFGNKMEWLTMVLGFSITVTTFKISEKLLCLNILSLWWVKTYITVLIFFYFYRNVITFPHSAANQCVKLTLQSCPEGEALEIGHRPHLPTPNLSKYNDRITAPLPVNVSVGLWGEGSGELKFVLLCSAYSYHQHFSNSTYCAESRWTSVVLLKNHWNIWKGKEKTTLWNCGLKWRYF